MDIGFDLAILYRGSLESCNYDCWYCPFAKAQDSADSLAADAAGLRRFVDWVAADRTRRLGILFTPWGEALVRDYYREALVELSHLPHVTRVVAQTNLSYPLDWLESADRRSAALWCSYHPSQTSRERFLSQTARLRELGIRHTVGMVGLKEDLPEIESMRAALPEQTTLWINAYKREANYYTADQVARLGAIDRFFPLNNTYHPSRGKACEAGARTITVDESGEVHRCHFVNQRLGNLYTDDLAAMLKPRACPNESCHCYIGYINLPELGFQQSHAQGMLERIPAQNP